MDAFDVLDLSLIDKGNLVGCRAFFKEGPGRNNFVENCTVYDKKWKFYLHQGFLKVKIVNSFRSKT